MKKGIIAVENGDEIKDDMILMIQDLATERDVEILGIVKYPRDIILAEPNEFVKTIKKIGAEVVFTTNPEALIQEIRSDGELSEIAKQQDLNIIDVVLKTDICEGKEILPAEVMEKIKKIIELQESIKIDSNKEIIIEKENAALVITKSHENLDMNKINNAMSKNHYDRFMILEMKEYDARMNNAIKYIIHENKIDRIILNNDYESTEFSKFLNALENENITIEYKEPCLETHNIEITMS